MSNFTDLELKDAVSKFVKSEIKTLRTDLGPIDVDYVYDEVKEFAASTFLYDSSSIFYLLSLSANRINRDVLLGIEYLEEMITAIGELGRDTKKITQTSLLEDAASSLSDVERSINEKNVVGSSQFNRYNRNVDRFINNSLLPNVRRFSGQSFPNLYEISRTPQEARTYLKNTIPALKEIHGNVIDEVEQVRQSLSELISLNLPIIAVKNSARNVRLDLRSIKKELDAEDVDGAIGLARDAFLRINAGKAVVNNLMNFNDPREVLMSSSSSSSDRAAAVYPSNSSTPAKIISAYSGPFHIIPSAQDEFLLSANSGLEQSVTLSPLPPASISGYLGETFDIHTAQKANLSCSAGPYTIPASPNNVFEIYVDGLGYRVTLTSGSRTAAQVTAEVNLATKINGDPGTFDDVATALDDSGTLKFEHDTLGDGSIVIGEQNTLNSSLGLTDGRDSNDDTHPDYEQSRGVDANNVIRFLVDDINFVEVSLSQDIAKTASQIASEIVAASALIDAEELEVEASPSNIKVLKVSSKSYGDGSFIALSPNTQIHLDCMETLGFTENQESRSSYVSSDDVAQDIDTMGGVSSYAVDEILSSGDSGTAEYTGLLYRLSLPSGSLSGNENTYNKLRITGGPNTGWYPITDVEILPSREYVYVGRPFNTSTGDGSQNQAWEIHQNSVVIESDDVSTFSSLVPGLGNANAELGIQTQAVGSVSGVRITDGGSYLRFSRYDVRAGDILTLVSPVSSVHTITEVADDGYRLEVDPEVPSDLVSNQYKIENSGLTAYNQFIEDLNNWESTELEPSKFEENLNELERVLNPILIYSKPSAALRNDASNSCSTLKSIYSSLSAILASYSVSDIERIDALLDMLQERGLDRAYDLLLLGYIEDFFNLNKDSASYGGNLLEKMRSVAVNDVPTGRASFEDNMDERLVSTHEDPDADLDFSDQDNESIISELDDLADLDEDPSILRRAY